MGKFVVRGRSEDGTIYLNVLSRGRFGVAWTDNLNDAKKFESQEQADVAARLADEQMKVFAEKNRRERWVFGISGELI